MIATFVQDGEAIDYTPATDVAAGDVVVQEDLIGVAKLDIPAGTRGALHVTGVFNLPKEVGGGKDIAAGKQVYWKTPENVVVKTAGGNKLLGKTVAAVGDNDATVRVRLSQ
ncbi:MAG: DUF2190 family protein [Phycisphaera sp.]|nr:DUF2190 family protein [Phycisphaera sp.]